MHWMQVKTKIKVEFAVFSIYSILLCILVARHEPWFDEAQAWLIARDASLFDLLVRRMRYEGSPGLWHLLLSVPAKLGMPYITMNILAGMIAAGSVFLFLKYSPFPVYVKIFYPFSFYAFYQYAVIARSYVLLPLLLFLLAAVYEKKLNRPYLYAFLLILLANVSLHGFIIAVGLMAVWGIEFLKALPQLDRPYRYRHAVSFMGLGLLCVLLVLQLKPPSDLITVASFRRDLSGFYSGTLYMLSEAFLTNFSVPVEGKEGFYFLCGVLFPLGLFLTFLWLMFRRKFLVFILPLIGLGILFTAVYAHVWHQGALFFLWIFALWVSYRPADEKGKCARLLKLLVSVSVAVVLSVQLSWSYHSFVNDFKYNYSAGKEIAGYIRSNRLEGKKIYMTGFHSIAILPYFPDNIFCNYNGGQKPCYWLWSHENNIYREPYLNLSQYQPDIVVMGVKNPCERRVLLDLSMLPELPGYRAAHFFDGNIYWKERPFETDSFALYEKIPDIP